MRLVTSTLLGVMAGAALCSAPASAEHFRGVLDDQGRPVPISLQLRADAVIGTSAGTIRFGGPWACGFDIELAQVAAQRRTYFLKGAGAGRCTVFTAGYVQSEPEGDGLAVALSDRKNLVPALYQVRVKPAAP